MFFDRKKNHNLKTNYFVYPGHNEPTTIFDEVKKKPMYLVRPDDTNTKSGD
jgi:hypothetical protein